MQRNIVWKGIENESLENCIVHIQPHRIPVRSCILGQTGNQAFKVDYRLTLDPQWRLMNTDIVIQTDNSFTARQFNTNGNGQWYMDNARLAELEGCLYVAVSETPFTHSLPIRRLNLETGERKEIRAVYIDVLKQEIRPETHYYTALSPDTYLFEHADGRFSAEITTDEEKFVKCCSKRFEMCGNLPSNYPIF